MVAIEIPQLTKTLTSPNLDDVITRGGIRLDNTHTVVGEENIPRNNVQERIIVTQIKDFLADS
jgi:hypothetical protein